MRGNTDRLAQLFAPVARAIHPPEAIARKRKVDVALDDDGTLSSYAANKSLGRSVATWYVNGTVSVSNTQQQKHRMPADGVIERFDINIKTVPTGASLKARLNRNGVAIATVTIAAGDSSAGTPVNEAISAGDLLTLDITQVGSTIAGSGLTSQATYREER